jgi:aminopeptidase
MTAEYLDRYAQLLVSYCLNIKPGDRLLIQTTPLAEPLVREVYKFALEAGAAAVEIDWMYRWRGPMLFKYGTDATLSHLSPLLREAYNEYETYLHIRAPYNLRDTDGATPAQAAKRQATYAGIQQTYMERTGSYVLRRKKPICRSRHIPTMSSKLVSSIVPTQQMAGSRCGLPNRRWWTS